MTRLELIRFRRTLRQVLVLPIVACLVLAGVLVWQIQGANFTVGLIEDSDRSIALATLIEKLVVDEETGLRGYQVTSDSRFLKPYYDAEAPMQQAIAELQAIAKPEQQQTLNRFVEEHQLWHQTFAEPVIATVAAGGHETDDDLNLTGRARWTRSGPSSTPSSPPPSSGLRPYLAWRRQTRDVYVILSCWQPQSACSSACSPATASNPSPPSFRKPSTSSACAPRSSSTPSRTCAPPSPPLAMASSPATPMEKSPMMNPVAQELTGWIESQARGRPIEQVFHIVDEITREPVENPVSKVLRSNRVIGIANHTVLIRKDGSEIAIDDSGSPIRSASGEITGIVMVFRDVTMERRTRAALLANEKLAVAGRLAATIAHEIHNPLDSVANLLYLLRNDPNDGDSKHFLDMAQTELARVTQISRAMLSLYRESKAPVPVNLRDMLNDLLLLMEGRFNALDVTVSTDLPPEITVDGFPAELRQVFTNLITNAAEAAGEGGKVTVRVLPQHPGIGPAGQRLEAGAIVEIFDDGPGISPNIREHLFQPFFTTKGERGTGLGLWVSQGIIAKHGGTIELISDPQSTGATARVFLASKPTINPGGD